MQGCYFWMVLKLSRILLILLPLLAQLVRSMPSDHKVPSSIPGSAEIRIFVQPSFPPKPTQLSILPWLVNEYQRLLEANLRWVSVPSWMESKTLICLTLQKPEISAGSMGHSARKGFSFVVIAS